MKNWEYFEKTCVEFLAANFGKYANFIPLGKSDSTVTDIKVEKNNKHFYIEAKHAPAQCGQFVLLPNYEKKEFEYSKINHVKPNSFSSIIISYLNNNFDEFCNAGTAGKEITFNGCDKVFISWILNMYKEKGVKFFITNNHIIFPLLEFQEYFNVSAKYRTKKSGSSVVGNKYVFKVVEFLKKFFPFVDIKTTPNRVYIHSNNDLSNYKFIIEEHEFFISKRDGYFEIRKLSKTYNSNVIFSITLKGTKNGISSIDFINELIKF